MRRAVAASLITVTSLAVVGLLDLTGALRRLELLTVDARILSEVGREPAGNDIVVAWIDQESMDFMRREGGAPFPWPRSVYGHALRYFLRGGAKAVVFDILFDQPGTADDDREFGEALKESGVDVASFKFVSFRDGGWSEEETGHFLARGFPPPSLPRLREERGVVLPIPEIERPSEYLGFVNVRPDEDKVFRHYDLVRTFRGKAYPSLALAGAMLACGEREVRVEGNELLLGGKRIPIGEDGSMALDFRGPEFTFEHVKLWNVYESVNLLEQGKPPLYPPERFKDKVVIVGVNAEGYEDIASTPVSRNFPGPELHATAIDNLLRRDALFEPPLGLPLAVFAATAGVAVVFALKGVALAAAGVALLAISLAGGSLFFFSRGIVIPTAGPLLGLALASTGTFLHRLIVEGRQKRELRRAFSSYMAPEVVREILKSPDKIRLGGETREVTVLFTDLAGFTSFSESAGPEAVVSFLNDYFTRIGDRIMEEAGIIDKFIGDAVMALFGAPMDQRDHAVRAVRAALGSLSEMDRLVAELAAAGKPPVVMRIGIHSGPAVVGNMGSAKRFDYTAIGDTVNLASRLEGANKHFGTRCLVSEAAWRGVGGTVEGRQVGLVRVMGRRAPIAVFEPLAAAGALPSLAREFLSRYNAALSRLRDGDRPDALASFQKAAELRPADPVIARYLEGLASPAWDGVFNLDSK